MWVYGCVSSGKFFHSSALFSSLIRWEDLSREKISNHNVHFMELIVCSPKNTKKISDSEKHYGENNVKAVIGWAVWDYKWSEHFHRDLNDQRKWERLKCEGKELSLVCLGYHNKVLQTKGLKQQFIFSLFWRLKSKVQVLAGLVSPEASPLGL